MRIDVRVDFDELRVVVGRDRNGSVVVKRKMAMYVRTVKTWIWFFRGNF